MLDRLPALRLTLVGGLVAGLLVLSGCVGPQPFRVSAQRDGVLIETPYSYRESKDHVAVAYFPQEPSAACPLYAGTEQLKARWAEVYRGGHRVMAILFSGPETVFRHEDDLIKAFDGWWKDSNTEHFRRCYRLRQDSVHRALVVQRPQTGAELLKSMFALDRTTESETGPGATLLLQPGMRVCANDVASAGRGDLEWRAGGASCARVVRAPDGGAMFDPVVGLQNGLTSNKHTHKQTVAVSSWSEIQRPCVSPESDKTCPGRAHAWLLIYPRSLPDHFALATPGPEHLPILAGIAIPEGATPDALGKLIQAPSTASHAGWLSDLCENEQVICYRFGARAVFTVDFVVFVNGAPVSLAVGSKLGDVAAMVAPDVFSADLGAPPFAADPETRERALLNLSRLKMSRVFDGQLVTVDLSQAGAEAYKLPLQPGDRLTW